MRKLLITTTLVMAALAVTATTPGPARATSECYLWDLFPEEALRLDIKRHSRLTTEEESHLFRHAEQYALKVHGKEVGGCGPGSMMAVAGTIVVARSDLPDLVTGAHMGLDVIAVRGDGVFGGNQFCYSIHLDCTSDTASPAPPVWSCESYNDMPFYHGVSTLVLVDPLTEPRCSIFQNGTFNPPGVAAAETAGPASGLAGAAR